MEVDVPQVEDGRKHLEHGLPLLSSEAKDLYIGWDRFPINKIYTKIFILANTHLHGRHCGLKVLPVVLAVDGAPSALVQVEVLLRAHQPVAVLLLRRQAC